MGFKLFYIFWEIFKYKILQSKFEVREFKHVLLKNFYKIGHWCGDGDAI